MSEDFAVAEDAIAIIGMSGRFPQAATPAQLWSNLRQGREAIHFFSAEELAAAGVPEALRCREDYVPAAAVLAEVDLFDAGFFGLTPREAEIMDPQHRLFLECAALALDDAGYDPRRYPGRIAVFGGAGAASYLVHHLLPNPRLMAEMGSLQVMLANQPDFLCSRVSYVLDLRGPSIPVQTACSTGLAATHLACQSLLSGESDMALAGASNISLPEVEGYLYQPGGVHAIDGHCRPFDHRATGSVRGNGVGLVLLKRLPRALEDGDAIHAVIRASAMNNDGASKMGFTAPSVETQAEVITEALSLSGVEAESITYVEAHGSGTALGDPIEVAALTRAFRHAGVEASAQCALGSVKSNLGHLNAAAGIAGLIKAVLALKAGEIVPTLHFEAPNPEIDLASSPFYVPTETRPWPRRGGEPRRAGVSSFGLGGNNVHLILEEAPLPDPASARPEAPRPEVFLPLSARSPAALAMACEQLAQRLDNEPEIALTDVAWTLQVGRRRCTEALVVVAREAGEAARLLRDARPVPSGETAGPSLAARRRARGERPQRSPSRAGSAAASPPLAFLFPGVGDHYLGMARELYAGRGAWVGEAAFREAFDACAERLSPWLEADLRELVFASTGEARPAEGTVDLRAMLGPRRGLQPSLQPGLHSEVGSAPGVRERAVDRLSRTAHAQPALFAVEYSLAQLLRSWGLEPQAMIGYSLGEIVAATVAGVLRLDDALRLVAQRARWIEELEGERGAMLAVPLAVGEVEERLERDGMGGGGGLEIAAENGPHLSVVAGPAAAVRGLAEALAEEGIAVLPLDTRHAFHTSLLEPIAPRLTELAGSLELAPPRIPFLSNLTGTWISPAEATDPGYWARHMCGRLRFADGLGELLADHRRLLLEVGPGNTLTALARQHPAASPRLVTATALRHPSEGIGDLTQLLSALGRLWVAGLEVDWEAFAEREPRRRIHLPGYPFERRRFWIEARREASSRISLEAGGHDAEAAAAPEAGARSEPGAHPRRDLTTPYRAPAAGVESTLAEIWSRLFGIDPIGADDSFLELGGHSLLATQVATEVRHRLDVEIPVRELFEHPVLCDFASAVVLAGVAASGEVDPESRLESLLEEIEELDEAEARALLARESAHREKASA